MEKTIRTSLIISTILLMAITILITIFMIHPNTIKETKIIQETNSYKIIIEEIPTSYLKYSTICEPYQGGLKKTIPRVYAITGNKNPL
jgi:predicted small secreted protein